MIYKFERKLKGANQVEATGEELTINNAGRKVQKFELSGRSEQKTRELSQRQASGEQVKLVDVDTNKFIDIFVNGNNEQKTTKGKQLFNKDNPDFSATGSNAEYVSIKNGFKIVCNKDETTWKGSVFNIRLGSINDFIGTLRIKTTAIVSGNGTFRPGLALFYGNANNFSDSDKVAEGDGNYGGTTNFDIESNITEQSNLTHLYLVVYGNSSGNAEHYMNDGDYTIYDNFIITLNNDDMTYEPYTRGTPSPNPNYPQDIEGIDGCNRFDETEILKAEGWTKNSDGYYNGSFLKWNNAFNTKTSGFTIKGGFRVNTQYILLFKGYVSGGTASFRIKYDDETFSNYLFSNTSEELHTIVSTAGKNVVGLYGTYTSGGGNTLYVKDVQFIEGTELKPYLPHGTIGLEQSGKNKVDFINYVEKVFDSSKVEKLDDGSYKFKHADGSYPLYEGLLKPPCILSFWAKNDTGESVSSYTFSFKIFYEDGTYDRVSMITNGNFARKEFKINKNVIKIANTYTSTKPFTIIKDVQLEEGSTATSYEPHHETKVIPINLQGNTLAKVGSIKDKLIIHRNGEVEIEKSIGKINLKDITLWYQDKELSNSNRFYTNEIIYANSNLTLSNYFKYSNIQNINTVDEQGLCVVNNRQIALRINKTLVTNVNELKQWLLEHDVEVYYQLTTPEVIKLPSINPIELWQGTVNIEIIGNLPTDMNINYNILPAMPSPDYPSQIKNVGDDVNLAYISSKEDYNYSSTLEKDAVLINGTSTNAGNIVLYLNGDDGITLKANKKYIVSLFFDGHVTGNGYKTIYLQGMPIGDIASNKMVTKEIILSDDKVCKTINLDLSANCTFDNMKVKVMITENGKLKEYIPYNCIKVTICNKNLYKVEKVINDSNIPRFIFLKEGNVEFTTGAIPLIIAPTTIKEKTEYTYILKCKSNVTTENNINFAGIYEDGTRELLSANKKKDTNEFIVKFKTNKEKTLAYVTQQYTNSAGVTIITEGTMILEGDYLNLDKPYKIHQEQEIIFPLTKGQKLYEGSYLAEDGIHNIRRQVVLNGTENWRTIVEQKGENTTYFYMAKTDMKDASILKSDKFINRPVWGTDEEAIQSINDNYIRLRINIDRASTIDELKKWLAENPVLVEYELAEEEIIPYTQEQQEIYSQLQNLELFRGCNHITVESNVKPTIKLSYYDGELDMTDYKYNLQFKKHMQEM